MIKKEVIVNCEGKRGRGEERKVGLAFYLLGLAVPGHIKWGDGARTFVGQLDFAELLFVFKDVLLQGHEQTLGMFGRHDDATSHFGLRHARQDASEIENEIAWRMRD